MQRPASHTTFFTPTVSLLAFLVSSAFAVEVVANEAPVIILDGGSTIDIEYNTAFVEPGFTATDAEDGDITSWVVIGNAVQTQIAGAYPVYYTVRDSDGTSVTVERTVNVTTALEMTREDADRFLRRATFGPTEADIDHLMTVGYDAWLDEQFAMPTTWQRAELLTRMRAGGHPVTGVQPLNGAPYIVQKLRNDAWMNTVLTKDDQLRQRVAFALSQIFVISYRTPHIAQRPQGTARYYDNIAHRAFGSYRNLLATVTKSPMMGIYLSMIRNSKADPDKAIEPDENYAREVLQLFSIGLDLLKPDGTPYLDSQGRPVPAYTQEIVEDFARVFTGWNYGDAPNFVSRRRTLKSELIPMKSFNAFHDTDAKKLLYGEPLPAGNSATQDLAAALDNIFYHQNVPPFIAKQLIQKLVTSNPSPAYVRRVADAFRNNGRGERGDLEATVRAVLMDHEALLGHQIEPARFGRLKEPLLKMTELWRAFDADGYHPGQIRYTNTFSTTSQEMLRAPSVFNFFDANFSPAGEIRNANLVAPEFGILDEASALHMHNDLSTAAYSGMGLPPYKNAGQQPVLLDIEYEKTLAADPAALVDHLITKLIGRDIHPESRYTTIYTISKISIANGADTRVSEAIYLLTNTAEFAIQR